MLCPNLSQHANRQALLWALYALCVLTVKYGGLGRHITVLIKTNPHALDNMEVVSSRRYIHMNKRAC
jgi:hypothetical protein